MCLGNKTPSESTGCTGDGAELDGRGLHRDLDILYKGKTLSLDEDEGLVTAYEGPRGVTRAASMLPAPGTLMFQGPFDVREDDGGLSMVVCVPESDAGDETLSYISIFMPVQCCLETQPVHIQGMIGI